MGGYLSNKILDKEFKKSVRGYSVDEVDEFLDELAGDFEGTTREINNLKERLSAANEKIEKYESIEKNLQSTLLFAQSTAESMRSQVDKEAELILREAEEKASKRVLDAERENEKLIYENERLRSEFTMFRRKLIGFMEAQTDSFRTLSGEVERENIAVSLSRKNREFDNRAARNIAAPEITSDDASCSLDLEHTQSFDRLNMFPQNDDDISVVG